MCVVIVSVIVIGLPPRGLPGVRGGLLCVCVFMCLMLCWLLLGVVCAVVCMYIILLSVD